VRRVDPRVREAAPTRARADTACIPAYHAGQTPGIRSTAMIAIGSSSSRVLAVLTFLNRP
jgi:hypothetical protein